MIKRPFFGRFLTSFSLAVMSVVAWVLLYDGHSVIGTAVFGGYRERWFLFNLTVSYLAIWSIVFALVRIRRSGLFRVISLHLGLSIVVLFLEGVALVGLVDFRPLVNKGDVNKRFGRQKPDKRLRWTGKPNQFVQGSVSPNLTRILGVESEQMLFSIQTDRYGLRNPTTKDNPAVLLLGDSILLAGLVPIQETVTERLEANLNISVLNISEPGYSPQEELIRLETTGLDFNGRIILHFIFEGNDLSDSEDWRAWRNRRFESEWPRSGLIKNLLSNLHAPKRNAADRRFGYFTNEEGRLVKVHFLYDGVKISSGMKEMTYLCSALREAKNNIEPKGGVYAVVFVPAKITVLAKYCKWPSDSDLCSSDKHESPFRAAILQFCVNTDIPVYDLTQSLRDVAATGKLPYVAADTHLNGIGHQTMASCLAPFAERLLNELRVGRTLVN